MITARDPWRSRVGWLALRISSSRSRRSRAACHRALETITRTIITWLRAQCDVLQAPEGMLLLDEWWACCRQRCSKNSSARITRESLASSTRWSRSFTMTRRAFTCCHRWQRLASTCSILVTRPTLPLRRKKMPNVVLMGNVPRSRSWCAALPSRLRSGTRVRAQDRRAQSCALSWRWVSPGTPDWAIDALVRSAQ